MIRVPLTSRTLAATLPLLGGLLFSFSTAAAQASADREVVSLSFEGNRAFSSSELAGAIATERTRCKSLLFKILPFCPLTNWGFAQNRAFLDEEELPADLLRLRVFYRQRGYRAVEVDTAITRLDGEVRVAFLIREGEPVRVDSLRIVGVEGVLELGPLRKEFPLEPGEPFDRIRLDLGKQLIRDRLQARGHISAVVLEDTYIPPGQGARITLDVQPGPAVRIGAIRILGADAVNRRVIRKFLSFEEGEYFDQEKILDSQRNLYGLEALRFANIARAAQPSTGDTTVDVLVQVTEAPTRTVRAGLGMSTTECAQTEARFTHRNFLGGARRLVLSARLSNLLADELDERFPCTDVGRGEVFQELDFRLRAELEQPYFFSPRNSFRAAVFQERETFPDIFVRNSSGAELAFTRRVQYRLPVTLSYRIEFTGFAEESADIFFCVSFAFCQPQDIDVLIERRLLSPLTLSWRYDRTNLPFSPTAGYYANAQLERADRFTGSDYQYIRFAVEAAAFEDFSTGWIAAARVRTGFVEPTGGLAFDRDPGRAGRIIHPRKRFFAGGPQSVRGFGQNLLGPRVLVVDSVGQCPATPLPDCARALARDDPGAFDERPVGGNAALEASLELRRQLGGPWGMVAFLDFGQVGGSLRKLKAPILTPGAGIRYRSPVGPLRLDVGYNPSGAVMLPVVAELPNGEIKELEAPVRFDPFTFDAPSRFREVLRRLQFQLSIGEAF
ncbi:MAG: outer membrane protein assembly factor [Gemmatimonadota bacterium]